MHKRSHDLSLTLSLAIPLILLPGGCSDDTAPSLDRGSFQDYRVPDHGQDQAKSPDRGPVSDRRVAEAGADSQKPKPDLADALAPGKDAMKPDASFKKDAQTAPPTFNVAFPNLSFKNPLLVTHAGDGTNRLFVVEQAGVIKVFSNSASTKSATVFLDITSKVDSAGWEEGLLGLAFHPKYKQNGYFYVNYTASNPERTVIARYTVKSTDSNQADAASEQVLLTIAQPFSNHNGGHLEFGPDGYLYIAVGDGGDGGDPYKNGQSLKTHLGKILRLDIDKTQGSLLYAIPASNPFAGNTQGTKEEIYAYGLRNPWRFSFDSKTGTLWAADVGQNAWEEINLIEKGGNYGWNVMEGAHCFSPPSGCSTSGLKLPIWEYTQNGSQSVTGGVVYRGSKHPSWVGSYIYADFISGMVYRLDYGGSQATTKNTLLFKTSLMISSFGRDEQEELYFTAFDGKIYHFK